MKKRFKYCTLSPEPSKLRQTIGQLDFTILITFGYFFGLLLGIILATVFGVLYGWHPGQ